MTYILTLSCPDRPGIVHAVSGFLLEREGNIEEAAQYSDTSTGLFFMRMSFSCPQPDLAQLRKELREFAPESADSWYCAVANASEVAR